MDYSFLIEAAAALVRSFTSSSDCTSGQVAAALITAEGNIYTGVCIDTVCNVGFCAEHAAIAEMLKVQESEIRAIVAINDEGVILTPCGRCCELLRQVNPRNAATEVILNRTEIGSLVELLPHR